MGRQRFLRARRVHPLSVYADDSVADMAYDAFGRRDSVTEYADGNMTTPTRTTTTAYDPITGGVIKVVSPEGVIEHHYNESTGRLDRTWTTSNDTTYQYDGQGRLWKVIVNKLNGTPLGIPQTTEYTYDAVGNLDLSTFDGGTPGTTPAATADDLKHDYEYDVLNRLDTLVVQRGTSTLFDQNYDYESDGQKDKVTEHRGSVTTVYDWTYDAIDRLTDESYTNSGDATKSYAAHYGFDLASNRVSKVQTGANAATTVNTYNDRDEMATTQTNGGPVTTPQYDPDGNTLGDGTNTFTWDQRTRECLALEVERSMTAGDVIDVLIELAAVRGVPGHIRSDNGPEFIATAIRSWLGAAKIGALYIEPGSPWENGYAESFHSKLRDELLNAEVFETLPHAKALGLAWRLDYNHRRPHSSLGYWTPAAYAASLSGPSVAALPSGRTTKEEVILS